MENLIKYMMLVFMMIVSNMIIEVVKLVVDLVFIIEGLSIEWFLDMLFIMKDRVFLRILELIKVKYD